MPRSMVIEVPTKTAEGRNRSATSWMSGAESKCDTLAELLAKLPQGRIFDG